MQTLTLILAGGKGERLYPLTRDRAKPAAPFGGIYRIIDFTLSNCLHSGLKHILILTQYRSFSLDRHVQLGWNVVCTKIGEFVHLVSAQQRIDDIWYRGTADAVYQNLYILQRIRPELTLILSGDHIYKMDYRELIRFHIERRADLTVATVPQPKALSRHFGVTVVDPEQRVISFQEKPAEPACLPDDPDQFLASMGIYVFNTEKMVMCLIEDAKSESKYDFGHNIIPRMVKAGDRVYAHIFRNPQTKQPKYWRDVGTLQAYWEAHMDLLGDRPVFNLHDRQWPMLTYTPPAPPARVMTAGDASSGGGISQSIISNGCILEPRTIARSVLSPNVIAHRNTVIQESIVMNDVVIEQGARVRRAIIDKRSIIPAGRSIGYDLEQDRRQFTVTDDGLVVVPSDTVPE
jgi:glucose-1-phosphate adenylyltransferase